MIADLLQFPVDLSNAKLLDILVLSIRENGDLFLFRPILTRCGRRVLNRWLHLRRYTCL